MLLASELYTYPLLQDLKRNDCQVSIFMQERTLEIGLSRSTQESTSFPTLALRRF